MPLSYKILAQAMTLASNAQVTLLTVGSGKSISVSSIIVTNTSASARTYRIAVLPSAEAGGSVSSKHYIAYDATLSPNETREIRGGITLTAGDQVRVYGSTAEIAVNMYGVEIS